MSVKLLPNLPIEDLTPESDYLGLIEKGNLIASFLKGNKDQFNEIKMFSLYGEWGSGKSSLMKYLQKELKGEFNTYFFEAWEYEKDENLAFSLLEYIDTNSKKNGEPIYDNILKIGGRILRGLAKSVKINAPLYPNGPSLEFDATGLVDELNQGENLTFYQILDKFKKEFVIMEDRIKAQTQKEYNIVFVDDLDRCEPEQVLNLLSAIKLFFTYGQKTIFFCGIDKKAVEEAVKTKYGEVVKANEYLEKIFDISFTMPTHTNVFKLVDNYIGKNEIDIENVTYVLNQEITIFFDELGFTNPRKIKKVLNKYLFLTNILTLRNNSKESPLLYSTNNERGSLFETILVLYLIIIHEFYPIIFSDFADVDKKKKILQREDEKKRKDLPEIYKAQCFPVRFYNKYNLSETPFNMFKNLKNADLGGFDGIRDNHERLKNASLPLLFCPTTFDQIVYEKTGSRLAEYTFIQEKKTIDNLFYSYISARYDYLLSTDEHSEMSLVTLKRFISMVL